MSADFGAAPAMHWSRGVQGTITSRHVFLHAFTIVRLFGPSVYLRCVKAIASRRHCTFLELVAERR